MVTILEAATASLKANGAPVNFLRKRDDGVVPPRPRQSRGAVQVGTAGRMSDARGAHQLIAPDVKLGRDVRIFGFVNLYGCEIGDETKIGTFVEIQKRRQNRRALQDFQSHFYL